MNRKLTTGVVCAALTPLDDNGEPCVSLLVEHCRRLLGAGCSAIALLGTTGEANSFTVEERKVILDAVVRGGIPAGQLIVGTGCCAIGDCVTLTRHALAIGAARVLMLPPFYYKNVRDEGVVEAYARTIEAIGDERLRLYLYNIPQLSGVAIGAAVAGPLAARYPGIIAGIKDSAGDWAATESLCLSFGSSLDVLVGSERFLTAGIAAGASGCVTATANAFAEPICELYARLGGPDAPALQERVNLMRATVERYPAIAALKELEARRSGDTRWRNVRPPLTSLRRSDADALDAALGASTLPWKGRT
ncbi:MAG TPA: dihydrodipicolinate synthase family protein [Candidatus Eremiobacteraceae bacterium]|jgi:4-hydroxy-tetrahydrodipicolinate synthase